VLFGIFGAGVAFAFSVWPNQPFKPIWFAFGAACLIVALLSAKVLTTGYIWRPWG
jgi:hypothetical protein